MGNENNMNELSEYINIKHGYAFKGEYFKGEETKDYLLTPGNFAVGGGFKGDKFKFYEGPVPESYILKENDLVVTMTDLSKEADTLGYSVLVPKINGHRLLHNQRVGLVEFKNNELDKTYLYFLLRSRDYRNHVISAVTGTTVKHTSPKNILSFAFVKPQKSEQIKIGRYLINLDNKIQLNRQMNQTLEQMAQALFKSWFVDFDPVIDKMITSNKPIPEELKAKAQRRKTQLEELKKDPEYKAMSSDVLDLFPDEFEQSGEDVGIKGWVPKGWGVKSIKSLSKKISKGTTPNKKQLEEAVGEEFVSFLKVKDLTNDGKIIHNSLEHISKSISEGPLKRSVLEDKDILLSIAGTIGRVSVIGPDLHGSNCNQALAFIRLEDPELNLPIVKMNLSGEKLQGKIDSKIVQAVQANFSLTQLGELEIIIPSLTVLEIFNATLIPIQLKMIAYDTQNRKLEKLRDTLLPKLISGELRIPDAEKMLGQV